MVSLGHDEVSSAAELVEVGECDALDSGGFDVEVFEAENVSSGLVLLHGGDVVVRPELDLVLGDSRGGENWMESSEGRGAKQ